MKTNILKCCAAALVLAGGVSCTDLLDMTPTNLVSDKTMWEKTENAEWAINSLYTYVYSVVANQSVVGLTESLTDMMKYGSYNYNSLAFIPSEFAYGEDHTIKAGYVDSYMGYWGTRYSQITNINEAFCNLKKYGKMSDADKTRLEAEIRFMRAYVYFDLVKRYKEVIIYDENMEAIVRLFRQKRKLGTSFRLISILPLPIFLRSLRLKVVWTKVRLMPSSLVRCFMRKGMTQ